MKSTQFLKEGFVEDANEVHADHEVQMARSDLFHAAEDALILHKLLRNVSEQQGLEGWVAAKITLAADYLKTVREYVEYQLMTGDVRPEVAVQTTEMPIAEAEEDVAEGSMLKSVKRGMQGWGGAQGKPAEIVKRNKAYDADTAKMLRKGLDDAPEHSPAGLQKRVLDRKLKGVAEGMPASVIQAKEKIRMASDEENKKRFAGKTKEKLAQMARRHGYGDKNPYAKFHDGITEDADFGMNYAEQLAQKVFDARPDLDNEDAVLNAGYKIAVQDLDSKTHANHLFTLDADFASDFVSAYGYLKRQTVDEDDSDAAIAAFLAKGGEIKKGKYRGPRKAEKTDYGSKHIGGMRDALSGKAGKTLGRAAKTNFAGSSAKPVVTTETTAGSVATVVNPTPKNKAKVGSLFGGTYKQKSTK